MRKRGALYYIKNAAIDFFLERRKQERWLGLGLFLASRVLCTNLLDSYSSNWIHFFDKEASSRKKIFPSKAKRSKCPKWKETKECVKELTQCQVRMWLLELLRSNSRRGFPSKKTGQKRSERGHDVFPFYRSGKGTNLLLLSFIIF